jgi:GNAT superfamily N-acetyltransferase
MHEPTTRGHGTADDERISVRPAAADDAPELARLAGELGYPAEVGEMRRRIEIIRARADHAVFVAERGGSAVKSEGAAAGASGAPLLGWVHVASGIWLEYGERAEILGLVVDQRARRGGVGRRLVMAAEDWSRALGLAQMVVHSNVVREESHRFYPALDFVLAKSQHLYIKPLR